MGVKLDEVKPCRRWSSQRRRYGWKQNCAKLRTISGQKLNGIRDSDGGYMGFEAKGNFALMFSWPRLHAKQNIYSR